MYIPKGAIEETDDYIPKGAIEETVDSSESPGILGTIGNVLGDTFAPGLGTMTKVLAQNPKSLIPAGKDLIKSVPRALADTAANFLDVASMGSPLLTPLFDKAAQNVPTPSPEASNAMEMALNVIPTAKAAELIPDIGRLGISGGKAALNLLSDKLGINATKKSEDFINSLKGEESNPKAYLQVLKDVRENKENLSEQSANLYDNVLDKADARKYTGNISYPGISFDTGDKSILPSNFQNEVSSMDLEGHSKNIQNLLKPFVEKINNNLSFRGAHNLQSELGKEGAKLVTNADGAKRSAGHELLSLRNTLKDDIVDSLSKNGDDDLADEYQNASDFFKNNVAPYMENATIRKVVTGKGLKEFNPSNIGTVLKKDDGSILPVAANLSQQSKNYLLADELKGATENLPDKLLKWKRSVDPQKLIQLAGQLENKNGQHLVNADSMQKLRSIMNDLRRQRLLKWGAGLGIPAIIGAEGVRRHL